MQCSEPHPFYCARGVRCSVRCDTGQVLLDDRQMLETTEFGPPTTVNVSHTTGSVSQLSLRTNRQKRRTTIGEETFDTLSLIGSGIPGDGCD